MGIGREMMEDHKADHFLAISRAEDGIWITKEGKEICIDSMTEQHLKNCIRILETKNDEVSEIYLEGMRAELKSRQAAGKFKVGQLIIYKNGDRYEIGMIKRIVENGAFVWYHSGETAAKTDFDLMYPIVNEWCILETCLGGSSIKREKPAPCDDPVVVVKHPDQILNAYPHRDLPFIGEGSMAEEMLLSVEPDEDMGGW